MLAIATLKCGWMALYAAQHNSERISIALIVIADQIALDIQLVLVENAEAG
jgi:hypothetical protein